MRGLPPLQALLLLIGLAVLSFAGSHYIRMNEAQSRPKPLPNGSAEGYTVEAEIEFIFSSPPVSFTLTQPSVTGGEDTILLQTSDPQENPSYETVELVSHQPTTYWLDVVWPEDAIQGAHHFVQIYISPNHGARQEFSFFSTAKGMNETFEYSNGDHHHE